MRKRTAKFMLLLSMLGAMAVVPASAVAKHGSDNPPGDQRGGHGGDDAPNHR